MDNCENFYIATEKNYLFNFLSIKESWRIQQHNINNKKTHFLSIKSAY